LLATVGRCGVTTLCAPPTVWRLFIQERLADFKVSLREVCGAGEPLNPGSDRPGEGGVGA
jgi:acetyl-CoA synthetase